MTDDNNKEKKRENPSSQKGPSEEVTSAAGSTTNVGDKIKKILDTGDVSRVAAKENQTNLLLMYLQAFHAKRAIRNLTPEKN